MLKPSILEFEGLGTHWWITHFEKNNSHIQSVVSEEMSRFEDAYSRFKPSSLVSKLNDTKICIDPPSELCAILSACLQFYKDTQGAFNISVGAKLEQTGYGLAVDSKAVISKNLQKDILISTHQITLGSTTRIDLGGIGKGWLIDSLAKKLHLVAPSGYIINGGGDIFANLKHRTSFALEHPFDEALMIGTVELTNGSLAVSSLNKRKWHKDGRHPHRYYKRWCITHGCCIIHTSRFYDSR
jgi:thiamine biosynthesis lipoprotein